MILYATEKLKSTISKLDSDSYFRIATYTKKLAFVKVPGKIYDQIHSSYDKRNYRIIDKGDFFNWLLNNKIKLVGFRRELTDLNLL